MSKKSPYDKHAWCTRCGEYILRTELGFDKCGRLICPFCGSVVRVKARKKNHRLTMLNTKIDAVSTNVFQVETR